MFFFYCSEGVSFFYCSEGVSCFFIAVKGFHVFLLQ